MVEEMLLVRGIVVSYQGVAQKEAVEKGFWHLNEVMISISGRKHWLWHAVDQDGYVLDEILQARRDAKAAKRLFVRLLKTQGLTPKRIVTGKLRSYGVAKRDVMSNIAHTRA